MNCKVLGISYSFLYCPLLCWNRVGGFFYFSLNTGVRIDINLSSKTGLPFLTPIISGICIVFTGITSFIVKTSNLACLLFGILSSSFCFNFELSIHLVEHRVLYLSILSIHQIACLDNPGWHFLSGHHNIF